MPRLMVRYKNSGKYQPFHPKLILRDTGYARGHWQEMHFREGLFRGSGTIRERNVTQAVEHYLSELKRMGYIQVE